MTNAGDRFTLANQTMMPAYRRVSQCWLLGWLPALVLLGVCGLTRATADEAPNPSTEQLGQWIGELDSDQFYVRRRAAEKLRELAEQPAAQPALGEALSRLLLGADTPYEVREVCEALLQKTSAAARRARLQNHGGRNRLTRGAIRR